MPRRLALSLSMIFKERGGIPRFNQMLCLALDEVAPALDVEAWVISEQDSGRDYLDSGAIWRNIQFIPAGGRGGLISRTALLCMRRRPDILLMGILGMAPLGAACLPFLRRGFGFIAHGAEAWEEPRLTRRVLGRQARYVLAVSRDTGEAVCRTIGLDPSAVRILPNTLAPGFEAAPEPPGRGAPDSRPEILTVARLWPQTALTPFEGRKGVDHTLHALTRLVGRHPGVRYRIVGKGPDKPRLQRLSESLGLEDHVIFEEDLTDAELSERYRRCAVFALPSGQEGFGIVFLEAMRFGKPIVAARTGGIPEVVEDGTNGLLVPFADVDALEGALDKLLGDHALRTSLGAAGRTRLEEQFTFERFRSRLGSHLREWLSG